MTTQLETAHLLAARHEHEQLGVEVRLDEREEDVQFAVQLAHDVVLFEIARSSAFVVCLFDADIFRFLQAEPGQVLHGRCLRRREKQRLSRTREMTDDGVEGLCEAHVQDAVCLVENYNAGMSTHAHGHAT